MRVLHLDCGQKMRGGQHQALRLHKGLLDRGHESLLLAPGGSPLLGGPQTALLRHARLAQLARTFDVIHAHDAHSHTRAALLSRKPLVVSRRVAFPIKTNLLSRWKYRRASLYIAVSNHVGQQLENAGISRRRIRVVYDGVAIPLLAAEGDRILAIDKDTNLAQQAARIAGVKIEIPMDLERALASARALLYLTSSEGLGSGILLAMAYGVPVIASDIGGIPELIRHNVSGQLVANNPRAIAEALRRIDPAHGRAARELVISRFTEDRMIEATLAAYRSVLSGIPEADA